LLAKPQIREFAFHTQLFENYQRSEKALLASICQMAKDGVSTNRVKKIVGRLSPDLTYSKSTVSRITQELDPQIKKWQEEKLKDHYVYMITDAAYFFLRENHQVISRPVLVTVGVDQNGRRKILGVNVALEESYASYRDHFNTLQERGLIKVDLTISDEHKGLLKAQSRKSFPVHRKSDVSAILCAMSGLRSPIRKDRDWPVISSRSMILPPKRWPHVLPN